MPDIDIILSPASFRKISEYLEKIKQRPDEIGFRLRYILGKSDLQNITVFDLVDALLKTKKPAIFAERHVKADGTDWNLTEINLLGRLGQEYEANLYLKSSYEPTENDLYSEPLPVWILHTNGPLLSGPGIGADGQELLVEGNGQAISRESYKAYFKERLLPELIHFNQKAKDEDCFLEVRVPILGGGAYGGMYTGWIYENFELVLKELMTEYGSQLNRINSVLLDYFNANDVLLTSEEIKLEGHVIKFTKGASATRAVERRGPSLLAPPLISNRLCIVNPGDRLGFIGVDALRGNRMTCDGALIGSTDIHTKLFDIPGEISKETMLWKPETCGLTQLEWHDLLSKDGKGTQTHPAVRLELKKLIVVVPGDDEFSTSDAAGFTLVGDGCYEQEYQRSSAYHHNEYYLDPHQPADYLVKQPNILKLLGIAQDQVNYLKWCEKLRSVATCKFSCPISKEDFFKVTRLGGEAQKGLDLLYQLAKQHEQMSREDPPFVGFEYLWDNHRAIYCDCADPPDLEKQKTSNTQLQTLISYGQDLVIDEAFCSSAFNAKSLNWIQQRITETPRDGDFILALNFLHQHGVSLADFSYSPDKLNNIYACLSNSQFTKVCAFLYRWELEDVTGVIFSLFDRLVQPGEEGLLKDVLKPFLALIDIASKLVLTEDTTTVISTLLNQLNPGAEPVCILVPTMSTEAYVGGQRMAREEDEFLQLLDSFIGDNGLSEKVFMEHFDVLSVDGKPASVTTQVLDGVLEYIDSYLAPYFDSKGKEKENEKDKPPQIIHCVGCHYPGLDCQIGYLQNRIKMSLSTKEKTIKVKPLLDDIVKKICLVAQNVPVDDWHSGLQEIRYGNLRGVDIDDEATWSEIQTICTEHASGLRRCYARSNLFFGSHAREDEIDFLYRAVAEFDVIYKESGYAITTFKQFIQMQLKRECLAFVDSEISRLGKEQHSLSVSVGLADDPALKIQAYTNLRQKLLLLMKDPEKLLSNFLIEVRKETVLDLKHKLSDPAVPSSVPPTFQKVIQWNRSGHSDNIPRSLVNFDRMCERLGKIENILITKLLPKKEKTDPNPDPDPDPDPNLLL